jgi:hypothetical protein
MNQYYNQNYTREQKDAILDKIKDCVVNNKYTIALNENRQENVDFILLLCRGKPKSFFGR